MHGMRGGGRPEYNAKGRQPASKRRNYYDSRKSKKRTRSREKRLVFADDLESKRLLLQ